MLCLGFYRLRSRRHMGELGKTSLTTAPGEITSPVEEVDYRHIDEKVRRLLLVVAGGNCQFMGCNDYLMEHHLTLTPGNFAQVAHIVAFKRNGPRGGEPVRPDDINEIGNLMLLCPKCHKLIDDHPINYLRETLEEMKNAHEQRIKLVTSMGPEMRTALVTFQAPIGGQHIDIHIDDIRKALSPRYPVSRLGTAIDLSALTGATEVNMISVAQELIQKRLEVLFQANGEADKAGHVSVFAIGPISMLVMLGSKLSNKIPTDFFQRHRDTENWTWKTEGSPVKYKFIRRIKGPSDGPVALMLSLSGTIDISALPDKFVKDGSVYEIILSSQTPDPTFLEKRSDLEAFRIIYQEALGTIMKEHGAIDKIALFPAIPAPVAILCGRERLPKVHPTLNVYDYDRNVDGFNFQMEVQ